MPAQFTQQSSFSPSRSSSVSGCKVTFHFLPLQFLTCPQAPYKHISSTKKIFVIHTLLKKKKKYTQLIPYSLYRRSNFSAFIIFSNPLPSWNISIFYFGKLQMIHLQFLLERFQPWKFKKSFGLHWFGRTGEINEIILKIWSIKKGNWLFTGSITDSRIIARLSFASYWYHCDR